MSFVHLHVHSHYSLLDGLPNINALVTKAKQLNMPALALTDHGAMYGAIEFYQACQRQQLQPIIGAELYVAQRTRFDKQPRLDDKPYHLVVLAETDTGYKNLMKLVSRSQLQGFYYKPRVDYELLETYHEGLIALSGCLNGAVARTILNHDVVAAAEVIKRYQAIFGKDNFFLEVQHHPQTPPQVVVNRALVTLSRQTQAPLVATADSHYLETTDAEAQDILVCIQTKKQLSDTNRLTMRQEDFSLASAAEMTERFKDLPEAITNTVKIAQRCRVTIPLGQVHMPYYALPSGQTAEAVLEQLCLVGVEQRYGKNFSALVTERLRYELSVIGKTGYANYFLIVQDFVNWARQQHIVVGPGRGSAAGSIVAYVTGITNIDPIRYDLLFERFLNPDRVSMPDIDLDFADTRRAEVIHYVETKYGKEHVAQIITFGTMAARASVRDVGRVLGMRYSYCDRLAKLIPMFSSLEQAITAVPELQQLYQSDSEAMRLLDAARRLEGVVRHTSTHACGVVITKHPLEEYTPIQYSSANDNTVVTQYSLHAIESLGLLKMDFLGLKNLTIIEHTLELIKKTTDQTFAIEQIPLDDKPTYSLLKAGQTTGIFQLESAGMKRYLRELKPTEFEDIIAMVALYRPGPMERIPEYIAGKHGKRSITYLHPALRTILQKTYGILVYQEQVMALVRDVAGFSAGEGYLLVKAVAKKIGSLLNEQKAKFIQGCTANTISLRVAEQLWEFIEPFARYGFNKSHSTGYALIAYQTAYCKAHYPAQFMASLLTSDQSDSERIAIEVQEARDLNIAVLPPDVNESFSTFTVVKDRIRFGLGAIKNVGQSLITAIINERKARGVFHGIEDFLSRLQHKDLNKKSLESLIKSGALDVLAEPALLLGNLETLLSYNRLAQQERASGQTNLFGELTAKQRPQLYFTAQPPTELQQKLLWEKDLLGLYVSAHPLQNIFAHLPKNILPLDQITHLKHNDEIQCIGVVQAVKRVVTKAGEAMQFVRVEDPIADGEIVVFPTVLQRLVVVLEEGMIVRVIGKVSRRQGEVKIIAEDIAPFAREFVHIRLPQTTDKGMLRRLQRLFQEQPGELPVLIEMNGRSLYTKSRITAQAVPHLRQLLGEDVVALV